MKISKLFNWLLSKEVKKKALTKATVNIKTATRFPGKSSVANAAAHSSAEPIPMAENKLHGAVLRILKTLENAR